jgi:two-component system, cell cycle sensor histidine kinase and response regulator CckA
MHGWLNLQRCAALISMSRDDGPAIDPRAIALHASAGFIIALSFIFVATALYLFTRRRREVPFRGALVLFSIFFVACAMALLVDVVGIWYPSLWLSGWIKVAAALIALAAVMSLFKMLSVLRRLSDHLEYRVQARTAELSIANRNLENEIAQRKSAEAEVLRLNASLQRRINEIQIIFDILPIGIGIAEDAGCRDVRSNRLFAEMLNLPQRPAASLSASPVPLPEVKAFHQGKELSSSELPMRRVARENVPLLDFEQTIVREDGRELHVIVNAVPLRDADGKVSGAVATMQDVTQQRLAAQERLAFERRLRETQKLESLGALAGGIAHDFNNLLTGIIGNASMARFEITENPANAQAALDSLEQAALRAADLCKQMLAYAGKGRFVIQSLSLSRIVRETTELLTVSIAKRAALELQLDEGLPTIQGDATQVRQLLVNLVKNAAEAIGDHGGVITLRTSVLYVNDEYLRGLAYTDPLAPGNYVCLEVVDNGPGMDKTTLARVFDPFFTTKFTGRGLGLAAVLGIVRGHKGAVKVQSEPNRGTTFTMLFPADSAPPSDSVPEPSSTAATLPRSPHVLLVEDEEAVRLVTQRILNSAGYTVTAADDGQKAVDLVTRSPREFDLVLLDMTMPNMDGEEAFKQMRKINPDLRVLVMSGYSEQETLRRFEGEKATSFLSKPFTRASLMEKVQGMLAAPTV